MQSDDKSKLKRNFAAFKPIPKIVEVDNHVRSFFPTNTRTSLLNRNLRTSYNESAGLKKQELYRSEIKSLCHKQQSFTSKLTLHVLQVYKFCSPKMNVSLNQFKRRVLTSPYDPKKDKNLIDTFNGDLIVRTGDIIRGKTRNERSTDIQESYYVLDVLGNGTFGRTYKTRRMSDGELVALKVLKKKPEYFRTGLFEIGVLTLLKTTIDVNARRNTMRMYDHFLYKNHICFASELLGISLSDLLHENRPHGLNIRQIQSYTSQLLFALEALEYTGIIHADLKPDNIMLLEHDRTRLRLIDFGTACFEGMPLFGYIQSRRFRAPEVVLGLKYTTEIDVWSLGCIVAEMFLNVPLFAGSNSYFHLKKITSMLCAMPSNDMIEKSKLISYFSKNKSLIVNDILTDNDVEQIGRRFLRKTISTSYSTSTQVSPQNVRVSPKISKQQTKTFKKTDQKQKYRMITPQEWLVLSKTSALPHQHKTYYAFETLSEAIEKTNVVTDESEVLTKRQIQVIKTSLSHLLFGLLELEPSKRWTIKFSRTHPFLREGDELVDPLLETLDRKETSGNRRSLTSSSSSFFSKSKRFAVSTFRDLKNVFPPFIFDNDGGIDYIEMYTTFKKQLQDGMNTNFFNNKHISIQALSDFDDEKTPSPQTNNSNSDKLRSYTIDNSMPSSAPNSPMLRSSNANNLSTMNAARNHSRNQSLNNSKPLPTPSTSTPRKISFSTRSENAFKENFEPSSLLPPSIYSASNFGLFVPTSNNLGFFGL